MTKYEEEAREAIMMEWGICTLIDGQIKGRGYKFETEKGSFFELGHKLVTNVSSGWYFIALNQYIHLVTIFRVI